MKTEEINIRDPFVLLHDDTYYLYGTRSATTWGKADGFDCYYSKDLKEWSEPIEIFHNDGSFWADRNYWAPEVNYYKGKFYFITTFGAKNKCMGIQILVSDQPTGPFRIYSDGPVTPDDWECLDGTLYIDQNETPYLIYSRAFLQEYKAGMYALELTKDLKSAVGKPKLMFYASDAPWSIPFPYAKEEFGVEEDMYFSDGPYLYRTKNDKLLMIWSSWGEKGYTVGVAHSDNDQLDGNWIHEEEPLFKEDGGHGMFFRTIEGKLYFTLHYPNDKLAEHPVFYELSDENDSLQIL